MSEQSAQTAAVKQASSQRTIKPTVASPVSSEAIVRIKVLSRIDIKRVERVLHSDKDERKCHNYDD